MGMCTHRAVPLNHPNYNDLGLGYGLPKVDDEDIEYLRVARSEGVEAEDRDEDRLD